MQLCAKSREYVSSPMEHLIHHCQAFLVYLHSDVDYMVQMPYV